ncbi:hypothetical protein PHYSODRAFT_336289 [Phytophthora sojae]|uniref:Uncharacterized protein n=1 Tax=Phytophthora sojae (strain P6497) TaxID=1094619 RepID=G4ZX76_PHYSP|nr:hypothetical protein PHYSODRAFT_336289 [Phytophthora sojae]EGZ11793.1 hypothetical protein PHYSODRAFT_336289 [Phytophthora sojae]|eukprot:XP_009532126.1 hypothetical protein PHYSODRAFT_336289 [Phytophthora sojae]
MKVQIVIAALATLLLPVHGASNTARLQCAGGVPDNTGAGSGIIYENSGFLTADFTQKSCAAAGGSIDSSKKGNDKCCIVPASPGQKPGSNYQTFRPFARYC